MENKKEIGIAYGVLCPDIEKQLNKQGYTLEKHDIYEKVRFGLNYCLLNGILQENIVNKAFEKLNTMVVSSVKPLRNKEND